MKRAVMGLAAGCLLAPLGAPGFRTHRSLQCSEIKSVDGGG